MFVEAGFLRATPIVGLTIARQRDEVDALPGSVRANAAGDLVAIESGKADVDERDVRLERERRMQAARAIGRLVRRVPGERAHTLAHLTATNEDLPGCGIAAQDRLCDYARMVGTGRAEARGKPFHTMNDALQGLAQYGYLLLFLFVLAEQVGLPVPAVPVLLGVGALAGAGGMSLVGALGVALAASLPADIVWYELGRRRGTRVLGLLCRISLEPDSCVRRTENLFIQRGRKALVIAKFLPGFSTVAPPLAGMVGIARAQFIALDIAATVLWAGTWMSLGYVFSDALEIVASRAARFGHSVLVVGGAGLVAYVLVKFIQRRRFLRSLRIARITPEELKRRLDSGDASIAVVDTRSSLDVTAVPYAIPGAIWIAAEDIEQREQELPRDREIVLYCS